MGPTGQETTTIRILWACFKRAAVRQDFSAVTPGGMPSLHQRLAYVPGDVTLWPNLTGGEVIDF